MKPRILEKMKLDRAELAEWQAKVERVRAAAGVTPREGLVHELAWSVGYLVRFGDLLDPNDPDDARVLSALGAYESTHGPIVQPGQHDLEMAAKLPQYENALKLSQSAVTHDERDLADAEAAERALAQGASADAAPDPAEIEASEKHLAQLQAEQTTHQAALQKLKNQQSAALQAEGKSARAGELHQSVLAWTAIAEALGPGGIPGEILTDALDPINERLMYSADVAEWPRVGIESDMTITADARPYALLSESEKWRVDAMIAESIAHISGIRFLVLDRFDVLDLQGRSDLVAWFDELATDGEIESCLLFGTLKALPAQLPSTFAAHWIEGGVAGQLKEAA